MDSVLRLVALRLFFVKFRLVAVSDYRLSIYDKCLIIFFFEAPSAIVRYIFSNWFCEKEMHSREN